MILLITLVLYAALIVLAASSAWLMWHGLTPSPRVDSLRLGTAPHAPEGGEARRGMRCVDVVYDQDAVAA